MPWTKLGEPVMAWANEWMRIVAIPVRMPTGVETRFYYLDVANGVAILAVDDQQRAIVNRQYRPALDAEILELPAGKIEKDEDPVEAASREMSEEAGLIVKGIQRLGSFYRDAARDRGTVYVYFARVAGQVVAHREKYEYIRTERILLTDLAAQVADESVRDAATVFAVLMLQFKLMRGEIQL